MFATAWYMPPYSTDFVGDDFVQLGFIAEFLDRPAQAYQVFHPTWTTWYYRPVQNLWFLFNRLTFGLQPFGYYWLQALWHALTIALVYQLSRRLRLPRLAAFTGAALFALHLHHHDVVAWISSIAIIQGAAVSVLAIIAYLVYLDRPARPRYLLLTVALAVAVLTIHEEGLLLLPFLAAVRFTDRRRPVARPEWLALAFLIPVNFAYLLIQITRPNITIDLGETGLAHYLPFLNPAEISQFILAVTGRWTLLHSFDWGRSLVDALAGNPFTAILFSAGLLLLLGYWFVQGSRPVRLGLLWATLHLVFIYFALWSQRPDLFAGRHLYSAWIGICLAIAGGVGQLMSAAETRKTVTRRKKHPAGAEHSTILSHWRTLLVLPVFLFVFLGLNAWQISRVHVSWAARAETVRQAAAQMKALLPELPEDVAVFAHRFVMTPGFLPDTLAVWYDRPAVTGGSLNKFRTNEQFRQATADFYILDYVDGRLYNLLPELQETSQSILLWHDRPEAVHIDPASNISPLPSEQYQEDVVAGLEGMPRLATEVQAPVAGWAALGYETEVPDDATFEVQVWGPPGTDLQVRITDTQGALQSVTGSLLTDIVTETWDTIQLPLSNLAGRSIIIWLEAQSPNAEPVTVYWANPRLVPGR